MSDVPTTPTDPAAPPAPAPAVPAVPVPPADPPGGDGSRDDRIREIVREEITNAIPKLSEASTTGTSRRDVEARAEALVRQAAERIAVDKPAASAKPAKTVVEVAPAKPRWMTRVLWGDK